MNICSLVFLVDYTVFNGGLKVLWAAFRISGDEFAGGRGISVAHDGINQPWAVSESAVWVL
jgi:hypothetical protein